MSWHGFERGEKVPLETVIEKFEKYVCSGGVKNGEEKLRRLKDFRNCQHEFIVFSPISDKGWGASPMNYNCWKTIEGKPICEPHIVPRH
jgi:hypothetical protein